MAAVLGPAAAAQVAAALIRKSETPCCHLVVDGLDRSPNIVPLFRFIRSLVSVAPESLHIMVTSTTPPSFSLGTLRRSGDLEVVGEDALRFSAREIEALLELTWRQRPTPFVVQAVTRLTAGWPAGVALFLMGHKAPPAREDDVTSTSLVEAIDPSDRLVLYALAAVPFVNLGTLERLTGEGTRATAQELMSRAPGAFRSTGSVVALAPALRHELWSIAEAELPHGDTSALRLRAAAYLREEGCLEEALGLFARERDGNAVNDVLSHMGLSWSFRCDPTRFSRIMPEIERLPTLCPEGLVVCARHHALNGVYEPAGSLIIRACERAQAFADRVWLLAYHAHLLSLEGSESADEAWGKVMATLGSPDPAHPWPLVLAGSHLVRTNRLTQAAHVLDRVLGLPGPSTDDWDVTWALTIRAELEVRRGGYEQALSALDDVAERAKSVGAQAAIVAGNLRARVEALRGALHRAVELGTESFESAVRVDLLSDAAIFAARLARWAIWEGDCDAARVWAERAQQLTERTKSTGVRRSILVVRGTLSWLSGAEDEARGFLSTAYALPRVDRFEDLWDDLLLALVAFRTGHEDLGRELLDGVLAEASGAELLHLTVNALLLRASQRTAGKDTDSARADLDAARGILGNRAFQFMPAADASMMTVLSGELAAGRRDAAWLAAFRFPQYRPCATSKTGVSVGINTLGPLELTIVCAPIDSAVWRNHRKSRLLFELLLASQAYRASSDEIMEYLWPDVPMERARHRLECAASSLRSVFRKALVDDSVQVLFEPPFYRLGFGENVSLSHVMFESVAQAGLREARGGQERAGVDKLRQAAGIYAGVFLEDALFERFTDLTRQRLADLHEEVVTCLAAIPAVEPSERLALWEGVLRVDPFNETAYQQLIALALDRRMHGIAAGYFRAMKRRLCEELQLPLPRWAHALGRLLGSSAES
ncbi:MAG: hypothetical protein MUE60_09560 [Candidatus Eisenbacteria bacterium]|nr:hypothetical protein [Candidatus Eisenbacteria bacterium]